MTLRLWTRWQDAPGRALAALVLVAALGYTGIEAVVADPGSVDLPWLLRWRILPALLWAAVAPLLIRQGAQWRGPARDRWRVVAWTGGFLAWHGTVNLLIRLPDAPTRGAIGVLRDALDGAVRYAPAALLLFVLLVAAGYALASRAPATTPAGDPVGGAGSAAGVPDSVSPEPLTFNGGDRTYVVPPDLIRWLEAEGDYVRVHATDRSFLVRGSMRSLQRTLQAGGRFVRIHRSTLVGEAYVRELRPVGHGDYMAVLDDGTELRVPRTRREALRRLRNGD